MRIDVISLFPQLVQQVGRYGVVGRAVDNAKVSLRSWNPRDYAVDRHRTTDDRAYGGGPGMVMKVEPLSAVLDAARAAGATGPVVCMTPQGQPFSQAMAERLAAGPGMVLVCGRYEGFDERFLAAHADLELSLGDYVLSGGELPAMVVIDACVRLLPGVLGHEASASEDSFAGGGLDHPHYTRPERLPQGTIPAVLLSGDHARIRRWRLKQALGRTWLRRPDLLEGLTLSAQARELLREYIQEQAEDASQAAAEPIAKSES